MKYIVEGSNLQVLLAKNVIIVINTINLGLWT